MKRRGQDLAHDVYAEARRIVLKELSAALAELEAEYEADAAAIKAELKRTFQLTGIAAARAARIVDDVLKASRPRRAKVLADSLRDAAKTARKLDQQTFDAIFGEQRDAPPKAPSGSSPSAKRWLRPVNASEDGSASDD